MFVHTFNTWLLAQLFHPFVFLLFGFLKYEEIDIANGAFFVVLFVISFFVSIPSLILARLSFYSISQAGLSAYEKLVLWMIAVTISISINYWGILLLCEVELEQEDFYFILPAVAAALLSILMRIKQFFSFQLNYNSVGNENEGV